MVQKLGCILTLSWQCKLELQLRLSFEIFGERYSILFFLWQLHRTGCGRSTSAAGMSGHGKETEWGLVGMEIKYLGMGINLCNFIL